MAFGLLRLIQNANRAFYSTFQITTRGSMRTQGVVAVVYLSISLWRETASLVYPFCVSRVGFYLESIIYASKRRKLTPAKESIIRDLEYMNCPGRGNWVPPPRWRDDKNLALEAIERCHMHQYISFVRSLSDRLRDDDEVVRALISKTPRMLQYASDRIKASIDIVGEAACVNTWSIKFVSTEIRADVEILTRALNSDFTKWTDY